MPSIGEKHSLGPIASEIGSNFPKIAYKDIYAKIGEKRAYVFCTLSLYYLPKLHGIPIISNLAEISD
jgi:hypothetical protein